MSDREGAQELSAINAVKENASLSRRSMVGRLALGAAAMVAAGLNRARIGAAAVSGDDAGARGPQVVDSGPPTTLETAAPWDALYPLTAGSQISPEWRLTEVTGVANGACVLTLENERGRQCRVHLCRNDGQPQGLVHTRLFDLVVMNGGVGDLPTDEGLAQAVAQLAKTLAAHEGRPQQAALVASLLPHEQRVRQYSATEGRRLR